MALSDHKIKSYFNKQQTNRFDVSDRDGLSIRVSEAGTVTFQYRYRYHGKPKRLSLGRYNDLSLKEAREKIPELRQWLKEGKDPSIEYSRNRETFKFTLDQCVQEFLSRHVSKLRHSTQNLYNYSLKKHALNVFKYPAEEITTREWYEYFDKIEDQHSHVTAQALLRQLKTCLRFCIERSYISGSDLILIPPKSVGKKSEIGDRVLSQDELKKVWSLIDRSKCYPTTRNVIKACMLFGARLGEVRNMEAEDINFKSKVWTIPKEKSKTKKKIIRPIAPKAMEIILWQIHNFGELTNFVFPSGSYKQEISPQTVNKLSRSIRDIGKMKPWTVHDFRRSLSTILSEKKVDLHVTEKMLGHSLGGILAVYNKHNWLNEQREAYGVWEDFILL
jgi:integrase